MTSSRRTPGRRCEAIASHRDDGGRAKLKAMGPLAAGALAPSAPQSPAIANRLHCKTRFCMRMKFWPPIALLLMPVFLPAPAEAADITGIPKIREGDSI